ncbi:uncharacterized protein BDZ83DRAFT_427510 [Colletotrichum acutatum]|uniref:Uncharacterized protein n=1 Tax=Glomerella acutata TaxID=27357 RepID=A0AAD9D0W2_GLOAC|nr:uncharacterized protein BDZ83DRAFT_427510 [Colletotrichum acutatum]KAK1730208.1 hypothetical protein BDZ83DRAFT_427510 [Colletotrichum acutatum]
MRRDSGDWDSVTRQRGSADRWCFAGGLLLALVSWARSSRVRRPLGKQETSSIGTGCGRRGGIFRLTGRCQLASLPVSPFGPLGKRSQEHARLEEWTVEMRYHGMYQSSQWGTNCPSKATWRNAQRMRRKKGYKHGNGGLAAVHDQQSKRANQHCPCCRK